jgi:hypothetical protein
MKLTKAQRHEIYNGALHLLEDGSSDFICCAISRFNEGNWPKKTQFPEFYKKEPKEKPKDGTTKWWPLDDSGFEERKRVLRACIRETAPKKRK